MGDEVDPTKVDPDHYQVAFENEHVRVLNVSYGPGEEGVMHFHPQQVAVFLTDAYGQFEFPDGTSEEITVKAGDVVALPPTTHRPANRGTQRTRAVVVELKA